MKKKDEKIIEKPAPVRINPEADRGLSTAQVAQRTADGFNNKPVASPSKSTKDIISENAFTYFNFIFFILAVLLALTGSYRDMTFLPIIVANT